ncbi:hypothetical protein DPMN_176796 [Dreissena polymorpha]|uniref:Carbohydrate sulfotransferase n=1 Tax=Dreissena polymorpha TaxID=45954 RepID=A0A9D4EAJ6_DREPO|nr:hypothetical protein DPMN_176796 [Dreissena polymorpha]
METQQATNYTANAITNATFILQEYGILFCGLPKVGSTFWKRTLTVLAKSHNYTSPFEMNLQQATRQLTTFGRYSRSHAPHEVQAALNNISISFIFVRDPYSRLYSAYVDKLYMANRGFWVRHGTKVVAMIRKNPSKESQFLGHDVTFLEFIQFILLQYRKRERINIHFAPMHTQCNGCAVPYSFIGHMETFSSDAEFLLNEWRTQFDNFSIRFYDFEAESGIDTSQDTIYRLYSIKKRITEVQYPFYNILLRGWCFLQLRGYISKETPFPFNESQALTVTREDYMHAVRQALAGRSNITKVKLQRTEALVQAYQSVPIDDMKRLREFLLKDCLMFGYDDRPKSFFERPLLQANNHIYLDGL